MNGDKVRLHIDLDADVFNYMSKTLVENPSAIVDCDIDHTIELMVAGLVEVSFSHDKGFKKFKKGLKNV